ncbi:MAG: DEAD/DEAH box helicase [Planctomycetes bacterium]|nr:DEAD/DEAH box helicase [Planctomycetota bacterium]
MPGPLIQSCSAKFTPSDRFAGMLLLQKRAVVFDDVTDAVAMARVAAHGLHYRVRLEDFHEPAARRFQCSCRPRPGSAYCGHVYAALLALDALQEEVDGYAAEVDGVPERPPRRPSRAAEWRQRIAPALHAAPAKDAAPVPTVEYYVGRADERDADVLRIEVRTRTVKKNGELSVPRANRIEDEVLVRLPTADRLLLEWMRRDQERSYGYAYGYGPYGGHGRGGLSVAVPWVVTAVALPQVLAHLAATGRVFAAPVPTGGEVARPLRVDAGAPFAFELVAVVRADGSAVVHGVLRRDDRCVELPGFACRDVDCLVVEGTLVRLDCQGATALQGVFAHDGPIVLPAAELPQLLGELAVLPGAERFLQPCLAHLPIEPPSGLVVLTFPADAAAPLRAQLKFDYGGTLLVDGDPRPLVTGGDRPYRRDAATENTLRERVVAAGLERAPEGSLWCPRAALPEVTTRLHAAGVRVFAAGKRVRPFLAGSGRVGSGIDWLEVAGAIEFDGRTATLPELLRGKIGLDGLIELGDGTTGLLPAHWLRRIEALRALAGDADQDGDVLRLPSSRALLLDAMLAAREDDAIAVDAQFAALRQRLASFQRVVPTNATKAFRGELRPYQRDGVGWLRFLQAFGLGGCLADDMGLGKTVQVLAHLLAVRPRARKDRRPSLLVAPRSVLANWRAEAARFAPDLQVLDFSGPDRWAEHPTAGFSGVDLVLSTYALVRSDAVEFTERQRRFRYVILDEAQAIKNADSQNAKAVRLLAADHRLALTGTPVENHLGELWSLFEFLNPGMLGRLPAFRALFGKDTGTTALAQNRELVQRALRPVLLRRTKAQVLKDLPAKIEQTLWCELEPPQRKRYDALRRHYRDELLESGAGVDGKQSFVVLEALLRLRQAACHEGLLERKFAAAPSAKFDELLPRLEDLAAEGHKALVFSQFTSLLDLLEPHLRARGLAFERLDGRTRDRAARIDRFQQDPSCPLFLISLKAGGFGLNLTAASYVFLLDPWWNPAVEMQAIDRVHRIGQQRVVNAYRVVCKDTVEERVLELQQQKKALCEAILGNERSLLQDLTRQDLELLLG